MRIVNLSHGSYFLLGGYLALTIINFTGSWLLALPVSALAVAVVVGGAEGGVYPGLDFEILPLSFAVVIIGGLGSLRGAVVGSLIVGLIDNFGKALFLKIAHFTLYAPMALILAVKPTGLFGRAGSHMPSVNQRKRALLALGALIALAVAAPYIGPFLLILLMQALTLQRHLTDMSPKTLQFGFFCLWR